MCVGGGGVIIPVATQSKGMKLGEKNFLYVLSFILAALWP